MKRTARARCLWSKLRRADVLLTHPENCSRRLEWTATGESFGGISPLTTRVAVNEVHFCAFGLEAFPRAYPVQD